jgi:hypothetical protein
MPVAQTSSLPRVNFRGTDDRSPVNIATPSEALPIRIPLFMDFAPWGEENRARYINTNTATALYGSDLLEPLSPFFTHQTQFLKSHLEAGGKALLLGLRPADAKQATGRMVLDLVADDIPLYERNLDGSLKFDGTGARIPTGDTVPGFRGQWRVVEIVAGPEGTNGYGAGSRAAGALVSVKDGSVSEVVPVTDWAARFRGARGSNIGFRMWAPTSKSSEPLDESLVEQLKSRLYRIQMIERATSASTASPIRTITAESYCTFSFKKGVVDRSTRTQYSFDKAIVPRYESKKETAFTGFGPMEKAFAYDANITELLTKLSEAEAAHTGEDFSDIHLFNFLSGVDMDGNPYHTFVLEGPTTGGVYLNETSNLYLKGGSDGTLTPEGYNTLVDELLTNIENSPIPFKSIARMPYDSVWDSGFPLATKIKFGKFHQIRPDVLIHCCTQDVSKRINTSAEDSSIGVALRSAFRSMQESAEFGTKAMRFCLVPNAGYLIEDDYDQLVPFLEYLCILGAKYLSSDSGSMTSEFTFGRGEKTIITRYRDHNAVFRDDDVRVNDWDNGLNLATEYDMSRLAWLGVQSIHEDHTSVLHSYLNVVIICNLTRIGHIVWRELAGDDQLEDDAFLEEVERRVIAKTTNPDRYDGRVDVTPNAYYTALDEAMGTAWHLDINMEGEGLRGVENLAIIAQRRRNEDTANG